MVEEYKVAAWGAAWAVFMATDVDVDVPLLVVWNKQAAVDLAAAMNREADVRVAAGRPN